MPTHKAEAVVIAISGPSGAGKTTLVEKVATNGEMQLRFLTL
jgi:uridine kinase